MICTTCRHTIGACTCPDADQKLHDLAYGDAPLTFKWCLTCDRHYARCQCATPDFYVIANGKEVPIPAGGFPNAGGGRTMPDLTKR